jgi:hypothetical protein
MRDAVVLFTCYAGSDAWNDLQRVHLALLRRHNPGTAVIPVIDGGDPFLPDAIDVSRVEWLWGEPRDPWYNIDTFAYRFFRCVRDRAVAARRYALIESDALVTTPLRHAFGDAWDADFAGAHLVEPGHCPGWQWWPADPPPAYRHALAGVMPSGVVLWSRKGLEAAHLARWACFAEVRAPTLVRAAGGRLGAARGLWGTVHCTPRGITQSRRPGVYHPVKRLALPGEPFHAAHELGRDLAGIAG